MCLGRLSCLSDSTLAYPPIVVQIPESSQVGARPGNISDFKQTTSERSATVAGSKISKQFCNMHVCLSRIAVARFPTTLGTAAGWSVRYVVFCCQFISSLLL